MKNKPENIVIESPFEIGVIPDSPVIETSQIGSNFNLIREGETRIRRFVVATVPPPMSCKMWVPADWASKMWEVFLSWLVEDNRRRSSNEGESNVPSYASWDVCEYEDGESIDLDSIHIMEMIAIYANFESKVAARLRRSMTNPAEFCLVGS